MKRYDFNFDTQSDCMCDVYEDEMGKYVKYSDIKDDRALLEEAVKIIEKEEKRRWNICALYQRADSELTAIQSFLTRAKEVLKG